MNKSVFDPLPSDDAFQLVVTKWALNLKIYPCISQTFKCFVRVSNMPYIQTKGKSLKVHLTNR